MTASVCVKKQQEWGNDVQKRDLGLADDSFFSWLGTAH